MRMWYLLSKIIWYTHPRCRAKTTTTIGWIVEKKETDVFLFFFGSLFSLRLNIKCFALPESDWTYTEHITLVSTLYFKLSLRLFWILCRTDPSFRLLLLLGFVFLPLSLVSVLFEMGGGRCLTFNSSGLPWNQYTISIRAYRLAFVQFEELVFETQTISIHSHRLFSIHSIWNATFMISWSVVSIVSSAQYFYYVSVYDVQRGLSSQVENSFMVLSFNCFRLHSLPHILFSNSIQISIFNYINVMNKQTRNY